MKAKHETLNSGMSDAELCRLNGWGPGTVLVGNEGYGDTGIRVTAVGESSILARQVSHAGQVVHGFEMNWTLHHRSWRAVVPPAPLGRSRRLGPPS